MEDSDFNKTNWEDLYRNNKSEYQNLLKQCSMLQQMAVQKRIKAIQTASKPVTSFDSRITFLEWNTMDSPFTENGEHYVDFSPQYWFDYFFKEAKKHAINSGGEKGISQDIVSAISSLFNKVEAPGFHPPDPNNPKWKPTNPRGYKLVLKDELRPVVTKRPTGSGSDHSFSFTSSNAADTWKTALRTLLRAGFQGAVKTGVPEESLRECMLSDGFVKSLKPEEHEIHMFWRGDGRDGMEKEDWKRTVDTPSAVTYYGLNESWHPYSDDNVKNLLWVRKAQGDNDYYTVVSITAELKTAACFPKLTESRAYKMPLSAPTSWSAPDLKTFRGHIAEVGMSDGTNQLMLATDSYVYFMVINRGVFVNTELYGKTLWGRERGFPERGVEGVPKECYVGQIPIVRVWYGYKDDAPFTTFLHPTKRERMFVRYDVLQNRYGDNNAEVIKRTFDDAKVQLSGGVTSFWTSVGADDASPSPKATKLRSYPILEFQMKGLKLDTSWK